jgi:hypothetical protein
MTQPPQDPYAGWPQPPTGPQHASPPTGPGRPWIARHKVLAIILAVVGLFVVIGAIGAAAGSGSTKTVTEPGPTITATVTQAAPAATVTETAPAVRVTVTPTANAQGQATQISDDGVYVIGQDIPGGTWQTSGGSQCYEATLGSTDTSNIIDNNNFTGPDTVSLAGAKAFDINGGCTWRHE